MEGYTLAVDFRNTAEARELVQRLEEMTAAAGGRLYFAKDSLARSSGVQGMYDEHGPWREAVEKADPAGHLATDLVRRLKLRSGS